MKNCQIIATLMSALSEMSAALEAFKAGGVGGKGLFRSEEAWARWYVAGDRLVSARSKVDSAQRRLEDPYWVDCPDARQTLFELDARMATMALESARSLLQDGEAPVRRAMTMALLGA